MVSGMIYLDWAATTPPDKDVLAEYTKLTEEFFANPSSIHSEGKKAHLKLEKCRSTCAGLLDCPPETLYFTSGGTESNNLILSSLIRRRDRGRIIISGLEHPSLWEPAQALKKDGWEIKIFNPGPEGILSAQKLEKLLTDDTKMVIFMAVHNETGVIQPMTSLIETVRQKERQTGRPVHIHSDLVQTAGKISFSLKDWDLDSASFSAHKIQGPRGIGLLYLKRNLAPLYTGGGQEKGIRPGTENLAGAAALASALKKAGSTDQTAARKRMDYLISELDGIEGCCVLPSSRLDNPDNYSPWIVTCAFPPLPGEVLVRVMDEAGYAISTGSACSSNKKTRTRALESMGIDHDTAFSSIRISQGPDTAMEDLESFIDALKEQVALVGKAVYRRVKKQ